MKSLYAKVQLWKRRVARWSCAPPEKSNSIHFSYSNSQGVPSPKSRIQRPYPCKQVAIKPDSWFSDIYVLIKCK